MTICIKRMKMMNRLLNPASQKTFLAVISLLVIAGVSPAAGQISLGLRGGYNLDAFTNEGTEEGAFTLGGEARFGLRGIPIILNPGADYYFDGIDGTNVMQVDANVLYPIGADNVAFTPYVGAGLALTRVSYEPEGLLGGVLDDLSDETDFGANVLGGATFGFGSIRPYAQARITFGNHLAFLNDDGDGGVGYTLMGGLLFSIGR